MERPGLPTDLSTERYCRRTLYRAIAHIGKLAGFEVVERSALVCLAEVFELYFEDLLVNTHAFAEVAGRTRPNLNDATLLLTHTRDSVNHLAALLDRLSPSATTRSHRKSKTDVLAAMSAEERVFFDNRPEELARKLLAPTVESIGPTAAAAAAAAASTNSQAGGTAPAAIAGDTTAAAAEGDQATTAVPAKPIGTAGRSAATLQTKLAPKRTDYIPEHLPEFPPVHTFKYTPVFPERHIDSYKLSQLKAEQSRVIEENLKNLMVHMSQRDHPARTSGSITTASEGTTELATVKAEKATEWTDTTVPMEVSATTTDTTTAASPRYPGAQVYPIANYQRTPWKKMRVASARLT
ncbi:hypothetical protein IWQ60_008856 [Tieghemiomyces parasiticus]|uniref:Transcription initiation factor TFIID subunit 8 n=1 Tax=Tieghemiomyces parasiticus TaxID=78921 RepID=A0A9W8DM70_9FUNG|nr:hypothetical protein IWQ60_008856 [Tieghemiomyces parasiticus]